MTPQNYSMKIIDNGRYTREAIMAIQCLHVNKRKWSYEDVEIVLEPIYAIGEFKTYNPNTKQKRVPKILQTTTFKKILELIIEDNIRYIQTNIDGYEIKFYTKSPEFYKYQYYLEFHEYKSPLPLPKK